MGLRAFVPGAVGAVLLVAGSSEAAQAKPAPVPCHKTAAHHFTCQWRVPGNGISGGAPVLNHRGRRVGYLHQGANWIVCQARGRTDRDGAYFNNAWGWTTADDGRRGWVNALWAHGGDNDGGFAHVPACGGAHGHPPRAKASRPPRKRDRCLDLRRNQGITVIYTTRREHYKVTQSGGGPPLYQNIEKPRTTRYGRVHLNATTCKRSRGHWGFVQRANVSRSTYGIYKDASNHIAPRGGNDAAGWGVTIAGARHHAIDVLSVACSSQSSFFGDAASFLTSIPYPKASFFWALGEYGLNKVVEYFRPKPSVRCVNLGTDLVRLWIGRRGVLHAKVIPDGAAGGDGQIVHRHNLSGDGSIQEVVVQRRNYRVRRG